MIANIHTEQFQDLWASANVTDTPGYWHSVYTHLGGVWAGLTDAIYLADITICHPAHNAIRQLQDEVSLLQRIALERGVMAELAGISPGLSRPTPHQPTGEASTGAAS